VRRVVGRVVGIAILVGALLAGVLVTRIAYREPRTDDAAVRANVVGIAPHVGGPLTALNVVDNQDVRAGDLLFVVDPRPFEVALERARAALMLAQSEVAATTKAIESATAEVARLEAERSYAHDHATRLEPLLPQKFVTRDRYDEARVKARSADAAVERARRELERQRQLLAQFGDVNARIAAANAEVHGAELDLQYCYVRAPFDGRVTNLNIAQGEYARAGQEVFALVDARTWYVLANFQETYLDSIRPGMTADVYLLSYPGRRFSGSVQGIGWAVLSEDARTEGVLPDVRRSLNWARLAQRIPVRIQLEPPDPDRPYRMGMTAVVTIRGDHDSPR
jgi:membrane fusion protein, multidrug efflux system